MNNFAFSSIVIFVEPLGYLILGVRVKSLLNLLLRLFLYLLGIFICLALELV